MDSTLQLRICEICILTNGFNTPKLHSDVEREKNQTISHPLCGV